MKISSWMAAGALAGIAVGTTGELRAEETSYATPSTEALQGSFQCNMDLRQAQRAPVILVPGTALTPAVNYGWNYLPTLNAMGWPVCTVTLPAVALADIQLSAEYVKFAIRSAYDLSGRKVQIIGFSQGGMVPRWSLRFAPDTRQKVDDLVSLSGSHHGSLGSESLCTGAYAYPDANGVVGCEAAIWQQRVNSNFLQTLNKDYETVPEVDYTAAYTLFDDVLVSNQPGVPFPPSSALRDGGDNVTNITLQDVCPANTANHRAIGTYDPVGYAIAMDALTHDGPAKLERILAGGAPGSSPVCAATYMPAVNPATVDGHLDTYDWVTNGAIFTGSHLTQEPPVASYTSGNGPKQ